MKLEDTIAYIREIGVLSAENPKALRKYLFIELEEARASNDRFIERFLLRTLIADLRGAHPEVEKNLEKAREVASQLVEIEPSKSTWELVADINEELGASELAEKAREEMAKYSGR